MKTKIIYISGGQTFDVADIRTAFEEVRLTLGLAPNVVLFGVPVDADDAGINAPDVQAPEQAQITPIVTKIIEPEIIPEIIEILEPEPVKKTPKRKAKEKIVEKTTNPDDTEIETDVKPEPEIKTEKVIPILSILSSGGDDEPVEPIKEEPEEQPAEVITVESVTLEKVTIQDADSYEDEVNIEDSINDDIPEDQEKTLEQLLAKMKPLREDHGEDTVPEKIMNEKPEPEAINVNMGGTLEQLATEFSETQDKIIIDSKSENTGKIGKLKNILPFKKAKREETGFMGDLFGWAGIAANDDEFSIPGFFTTSASKK